jgi:hypothetical protein
VLEGWHLQEALNYYYLLRSMKLRGIVHKDALCIPTLARLVGCPIEMDESFLHSYSGLQEGAEKNCTVLGFNHDIVNRYCNRFHEYDMNFPLSQYKYKRLSESFDIARVVYEGSGETMTIEGDGIWKSCKCNQVGKCNAFLYWIEYHLPVQQGVQVISTDDEYHHQSIRLFQSQVHVDQDSIFRVQFNLNSEGLKDYDWSFGFE